MSIVVRLPFPDADLFPNRKNGKHWSATQYAKKLQFNDAYWATVDATKGGWAVKPDGDIPLSLLYLTPDKRKRDADNMLAASKALIDGMAKALGVDDRRFRPILVDWAHGPDKVGALIVGVGVQMMSGVNL